MKKTFMWLAALSVAAVFSSCEKKPDGEDQKSDVVYEAEAQKAKLQDIALELMGKFNPADQKQIVELSDYLTELYENYDWDFSEVEDHYKEDYEFLAGMNRNIREAALGNVTSNFATDLLQKAAGNQKEIYKFANIDAVWEADEVAHVWKYKGKGDGGLLLKFKGPGNVACEALLTGVDGDITYSGSYWVWDRELREDREVEFEATLPKKVNFSLKEGGTALAGIEMNFDVQKSDHFNFDFSTQITNITIAGGVKISKNAAGCVYSVKLGNENLVKAVADLNNCGLPDKANYQDWEDWFQMYCDLFEAYELQTGAAVAQVDILDGKLTIKTQTTDGMQFFKDYVQLDEQYEAAEEGSDRQWWNRYWNQAPYNKDLSKLLNQFLNVDLYYGDSKSVQAQMKWEAYYEDEEIWNYETQEYEMHPLWDNAPMIYFPYDGTSYNFEKYFTEKAFNRVINAAESFINSYIRLSKRWGKDVEVEF